MLLSIARMSKLVQESLVCHVYRRGAEGVQMGALRAQRLMRKRRKIASSHMRTDDTRTNGCSTTSASPMLSKRVTARCLERTTELEENNQPYLCSGDMSIKDLDLGGVTTIFSCNTHNHSSGILCHLNALFKFVYITSVLLLTTGRPIDCGPKTPSKS